MHKLETFAFVLIGFVSISESVAVFSIDAPSMMQLLEFENLKISRKNGNIFGHT